MFHLSPGELNAIRFVRFVCPSLASLLLDAVVSRIYHISVIPFVHLEHAAVHTLSYLWPHECGFSAHCMSTLFLINLCIKTVSTPLHWFVSFCVSSLVVPFGLSVLAVMLCGCFRFCVLCKLTLQLRLKKGASALETSRKLKLLCPSISHPAFTLLWAAPGRGRPPEEV